MLRFEPGDTRSKAGCSIVLINYSRRVNSIFNSNSYIQWFKISLVRRSVAISS
jgi:hypothetical protein